MNLTFCAYPRSGRHKLQALLYQLDNFRTNGGRELVVHHAGLFDSMEAPKEWLSIEDADPVADHIFWDRQTNRNHLCIAATHHVPGRVPEDQRINIIRHPVAVAISVAKKWQAEMEKTDREYESFLSCFIRHGARRAAEVFKGNIWPVDLVEFMSQVTTPCLKFETLDMVNLRRALEFAGISADLVREGPAFSDLQKQIPSMYRAGKSSGHWDELPEGLQSVASHRYRWILKEFYNE